MKCSICKYEVDPLEYGKLRMKAYTKIKVLDEEIKGKETVLRLTLCKDCQERIKAKLVCEVLGFPQPEDEQCDHNCGSCDMVR